jgi:hypothetical protein
MQPQQKAEVDEAVEVNLWAIPAYRVLHNSLHFSFSKIFVWSCLLWLSVTPLLSAVQRI